MKSILNAVGLFLAIGLSLAACASGPGSGREPDLPPVTAEERPLLETAMQRGALLYSFDQAAWHSTDLARERIPQRAAEIRGWVVEGDADNQTVTYYGGTAETLYAIFKADMRRDQVMAAHEVRPGDADRPLSVLETRMVQAQDAAVAAITAEKMQPCGASGFNPVVIPPASADGDIDVYLLTPEVRSGVYPAGGHYLAQIGSDGRVKSTRRFTYTCLDLTTSQQPASSPAFFVITHLLDPTPTEIHVLLSLWVRKPLYVAMRERLWVVNEGQIGKLGSKSPPVAKE